MKILYHYSTMKLKNFCLIVCAVCGIFTTNAQTEDQIFEAWKDGNYVRLLEYHVTADSSLLPIIEDALALVHPNLEQLNYDQLEEINRKSANDSLVINLLTDVLNKKKRQIIAQLYSFNGKELLAYLQKNPSHQDILYGTFKECVFESLDSVPLAELMMLQDVITDSDMQALNNELSTRAKERKDIMKGNMPNFIQNEALNLYRLQYVISRKTHTYIYKSFENICYQYAALEEFSDDPAVIERQFASIVKQNLSSDQLRQYLQLEADAYCEAVNAGRSRFSQVMGLKQFTPMRLTIPQLKMGYVSDKDILERIQQAKENYQRSRENIDDAASVASWFAGGLFGRLMVRGGKMLAERWAGSNLSEDIIYTRLAYMESCYVSLLKSMEKQIATISNDLREQTTTNEQQFIDYVKNK